MKRLLVTGSRDWTNKNKLALELGQALGELATAEKLGGNPDWKDPRFYVLVSGACPTGADAMAEEIWKGYGLAVERHPADWRKHGKKAGPIRNAEMVSLGADLCLAFLMPCVKPEHASEPPHPSHGGNGTAILAEQSHIETRRIEP